MAKVQKVGREVPVQATVERFQVVDAGSGQDVLSKGLDAVKARVSLAKTGQHVEYIIRVFFDGQSWHVTKRFNEFATLHEILKKKLASVPIMPSKSVVRQFAPEYLEARKNGLASFLKEVCRRRDAVNCREVQDFLLLRQRVPHLAHPDASEPVQSAEVQEASFGIAHFDYDPVQGLLLLGSSDFSWASRVDTKITNIKMPWEKKAPNLPSSQISTDAACGQSCLGAMFQEKYVGHDSGWSRTARVAALVIATGVVAFTTWSLWLADAQEDELLAKVLKELRRRLFHIARDVAVIAKDVRAQLEAQGVRVNDEQLRQELALECRIAERFKAVQAEVLAAFGCSEDTIATITDESAEEVKQHAEDVKKMMREALGGVTPLLPGVDIPPELSEEKALELYGEMQELKIEKAKILATQTRGRRFAKQELASAVALISQASEQEVLEKHSDLVGEPEVFHCVMALYGQSKDFQEKLTKLDASHRKQMVEALSDTK
eukprot:symbB.v1.2.003617.t1/scaffold203.1/size271217/9